MQRILTVFVLVIFSMNGFSQGILFEKDITLRSIFKDDRESLPIVNNEKQEIVLFLLDNVEIKGLKFNMKYELKDEITTEKPDNKYKILLGHSITNEEYHIFFMNEKKNKYFVKTIDFTGDMGDGKQLPLKFKEEIFLESISYNNKFYILTIEKFSSKIRIYVFEGNELSRTEELDFSKYKFSNSEFPKLFDVLVDSPLPFQYAANIQKIDNSNPNPLDMTTRENKIYYYNNSFYLILDNDLLNSKVISISLDDFSSSVHFYNQLTVNCEYSERIKSNSYLFKDFFFQIKACKDELCLRVTDFKTDSIIKEYRVSENDEIGFRNTPLMQKGGTTIFTQDTDKELNSTKQVLKKISASDVGVTAKLSDNNIELTIGGYKEVQASSGVGGYKMDSPGYTLSTPNGTISQPPTYHYNPTMYGYNTYANTRAVFFKSLFDMNDFDHVSGEVSMNAYDRIENYEEVFSDGMSSKTIFRVDDHYVFGYYKKWDKKYLLVKFNY